MIAGMAAPLHKAITTLCMLLMLSVSLLLPQPQSGQTHAMKPGCAMCSHCGKPQSALAQCCVDRSSHNNVATVPHERDAVVLVTAENVPDEVMEAASAAPPAPTGTITVPRSPIVLRL